MNWKNWFLKEFRAWRYEIWEHKKLILLSILLLIIAVTLNSFASIYVDNVKGNIAVSDLILDNIPVVNLDWLFVYGSVLTVALLFSYPLFFKIKELHVVISQFSLLILIRSFFVILTHLQYPTEAILTGFPKIYNLIVFNNDLFFSGHVAIAFLGFWLFRKEKIRIFFLISTIVMAVTVLFMHVHYSIDVFAAIFITYGSYKIGNYIFRKFENRFES